MSHMAAKPRPYAELGGRIARARHGTGLSQERFAPEVGLTRRHLIRLENGEHQVSARVAERIASFTGVPASEFRTEEAARPGDPFHGSNGAAASSDRDGG